MEPRFPHMPPEPHTQSSVLPFVKMLVKGRGKDQI